jgi:hypothetical protein
MILLFIFLSAALSFAQMKGGRWMFENNGNDEADWDEFNNDGSLSASGSFGNIAPLQQGSFYLSLEDSLAYGDFTTSDQNELDFNNENLGISFWIYPIKGNDNPQFLLIKGNRSGTIKTNNYAVRINNGFVEFILHSETGAQSLAVSSFKVVENEWVFIAVFYDFSNSKLYFWNDADSAPVDTIDFNAPLFPNSDKLYIGTAGKNGFKRFWGRIDDLRISNKIWNIIENLVHVELTNNDLQLSNFILNQNYPNPFNPNTRISWQSTVSGWQTLKVYDVFGNGVAILVDGYKPAGRHEVEFNSIKTYIGESLSSGIYYYQLKVGDHIQTHKMILLK